MGTAFYVGFILLFAKQASSIYILYLVDSREKKKINKSFFFSFIFFF